MAANTTDFISTLCDDILFTILSKLNIKEQVRTSILSSRWSNLWTFNTCLNIDAADLIPQAELMQPVTNCQIKILKFTKRVDQILTMHRGQYINQLQITYPLDHSEIRGDDGKLDSWIHIAEQKQVKALYLDFNCNCVEIFSLGSATFSCLGTLYLKYACLTEQVIHGLLSNSPNLLDLSLIECIGFTQLSISGSSLKLKHLELISNFVITSLEISAPNLVSFSFSPWKDLGSWPKRICFDNIARLTQLSCPLGLMLHAWYDFCDLLPQLVTLTLTLTRYSIVKDIPNIPNFPKLTNIKQMHVRFLPDKLDSRLLHFLSGLFKASPHLCRLLLDLGTYMPQHNFIQHFPGHKFIKELEIDNFKGFDYEVQLVIHIAESCSSLQTIIIHPDSFERTLGQESMESVVKKLPAKLPHKELEIVFKARNSPNTYKF